MESTNWSEQEEQRDHSSSLPLHKRASIGLNMWSMATLSSSRHSTAKYARDLPMTHASIAIQHFTILAFIRDPKGASCVVCMLSMVVVREGRNLLLLWLGHVGLWYLWQQQDTDLKARMLYGWLNGMRGIGSTKRNL
ncbi:hypothetical protein O0I10_013177 [Lichtheimia ornata]|uniref:Uncharacterized protein n=1 Tax=Lichtheimia ornata TaxID=688661 RepID=A0AAD7UPT9_9FUNG|nr:uncharacterized protein O0I10_013177 [Lichtheimia ornata]KAJ8651327.1 hypothetical protein O0I10_013177 [Lichtheimia ornata]